MLLKGEGAVRLQAELRRGWHAEYWGFTHLNVPRYVTIYIVIIFQLQTLINIHMQILNLYFLYTETSFYFC